MNFEEFTAKIEAVIRENFPDAKFSTSEVSKLADESYTGLSIVFPGSCVAPAINLTGLYEVYEEIEDFDMISRKTIRSLKDAIENAPDIPTESLTDWEKAKKNLFIVAINTKKNTDYLRKVPHTDVMDLSIVYAVKVDDPKHNISGSVTVTNDIMESHYKVTLEQLHDAAMHSTGVTMPASFRPIREIFKEAGIDTDDLEIIPPEDEMYVATNIRQNHGAGVMFYPGFLQECSDILGCRQLIVVPSSTEEVLIMRFSIEQLVRLAGGMISSINTEMVEDGQVLSNNCYIYDRDADQDGHQLYIAKGV